ncbi:adenylyltransferase/cytidyltransferase family protein [Thiopseudomonas denitrificans]|uniref:Glycerol-3-phosphate cytidylyltransferase n=1 Tax=Thiopseudomonas denitrificans TaxID=1501432 RepID=A0A4R6TSU4_9GAMM|nr:adenylyltransferase/cytidyltransferase family protein [Thiopseudomonas denitrificans]TDQ36710.1 glycerol-3-phosphate cytidylyltransferase [Thiopseudomonas denitrificans]
MQKTILTYGTFDLFHIGHLRLLERLRAMGDRLVVGVSTDEFNASKGKKTVVPFADRLDIVRSLRCVDLAIAETCWEQKAQDIAEHQVSILGMGDDWAGKFDDLSSLCEVVYLPRTLGISTTDIRNQLRALSPEHINELKQALDMMSAIVARFD